MGNGIIKIKIKPLIYSNPIILTSFLEEEDLLRRKESLSYRNGAQFYSASHSELIDIVVIDVKTSFANLQIGETIVRE